MRRRFRKYCLVWLALMASSTAAVAGFNLVVDPFRAYRLYSNPDFDQHKTKASSRTGKAEILHHADLEVLLLGSSLAEVGFDPLHPSWDNANVYNIALHGTNLYETGFVFRQALATKPRLRKVVLFADFLMFSDQRAVKHDFDRSRFNPRINLFEYHLENLLSLYATGSSADALADWLTQKKTRVTARGNIVPLQDATSRNPRRAFDQTIRAFLSDPETYGGFVYSGSRLDVFGDIIAACRDKGIELVTVISPTHALDQETVRAAGLWETFERWKRDLVEALADDLRRRPAAKPEFTLWDFTGYNAYTTEPVPPPEQKRRMTWYIECSHFRGSLGSLVLYRINGQTPPEGPIDESFGVRLTADNIDAHLAGIRARREVYAGQNPEEIANVAQIALEVAKWRARKTRAARGKT